MGWYRDHVLGTGRSGALWLLLGFLVTYAVTRWITTTIRRRRQRAEAAGSAAASVTGPIKDIHIGGVHVHHQVWGILLVLLSGLLVIRFDPGPPWLEFAAAAFGAGAALALDEFALWLHLEDVYWTEQGRKSIDAVMIAGVVVVVLLLGTTPLGVDRVEEASGGWWTFSFILVVHLAFTVVAALKGRIVLALLGLPLPVIALVVSFRVARPDSFWARRFYRDRPRKMKKAQARAERYDALRRRARDVVAFGGFDNAG